MQTLGPQKSDEGSILAVHVILIGVILAFKAMMHSESADYMQVLKKSRYRDIRVQVRDEVLSMKDKDGNEVLNIDCGYTTMLVKACNGNPSESLIVYSTAGKFGDILIDKWKDLPEQKLRAYCKPCRSCDGGRELVIEIKEDKWVSVYDTGKMPCKFEFNTDKTSSEWYRD